MKKTWSSNRELAISIMELVAFIVQFIFTVFSFVVTVIGFDMLNTNTTWDSSVQISLYLILVLYIIEFLICVPFLIVAVRNFKTKRSNNEMLIAVICSVFAISFLFLCISSLSDLGTAFIPLIRLAYHVILMVLVVQQLREKRGISRKGSNTEFQYNYNAPVSTAQIPKQKCGHCGSDIDPYVKFCGKCGAPVSENKTEPFQYK